MTLNPTGQLVVIDDAPYLSLSRTFRAPIDDVWASVTDSERLERWIGIWEGTPAVGNTVTFTMTAEEGAKPEDVHILECAPPHRFLGDFTQGEGAWRIGLDLEESDGITTLTLTQAMRDDQGTVGSGAGGYGPGWEYYLDRLLAVRLGSGDPDWDDYYPAMRDYYDDLVSVYADEIASAAAETPPLT